MITDNGPKLVLSPKYINDIRNDDRLSFGHETAGVASIPLLNHRSYYDR